MDDFCPAKPPWNDDDKEVVVLTLGNSCYCVTSKPLNDLRDCVAVTGDEYGPALVIRPDLRDEFVNVIRINMSDNETKLRRPCRKICASLQVFRQGRRKPLIGARDGRPAMA